MRPFEFAWYEQRRGERFDDAHADAGFVAALREVTGWPDCDLMHQTASLELVRAPVSDKITPTRMEWHPRSVWWFASVEPWRFDDGSWAPRLTARDHLLDGTGNVVMGEDVCHPIIQNEVLLRQRANVEPNIVLRAGLALMLQTLTERARRREDFRSIADMTTQDERRAIADKYPGGFTREQIIGAWRAFEERERDTEEREMRTANELIRLGREREVRAA